MIFHILIGQRKCSYPGQYAPEALEIADEYTTSDNPGWMIEKNEYYDRSKEFDALAIIVVHVPGNDIKRALYPKPSVIDGKVISTS